MTVLVTGASGFIGRHLTAYFDRIEQPYIAQTRTPSNYSDNWVVDLSNRITDFPDGVDLVIHLAARSPLPRSSITSYLNDNVTVTYNLVEACRNGEVRKLLFSSAIDCYGDVSADIVDENTAVGNLGKSKW